MSALAEALVAAQRRALSAMEKGYVAGALSREAAVEAMREIGLDDVVDRDRLLAALDVIREWGAALPAEPSNGAPAPKGPEPATDAQLVLVAKLLNEKNIPPENNPSQPLTKAQAHEIIDTLKAGTYDAAKWTVPF